MLPDFFLLFSFPCSADHERDWLPRKIFSSGWRPVGVYCPARAEIVNLSANQNHKSRAFAVETHHFKIQHAEITVEGMASSE